MVWGLFPVDPLSGFSPLEFDCLASERALLFTVHFFHHYDNFFLQ